MISFFGRLYSPIMETPDHTELAEGRRRILCVDDDPNARRLLEHILRKDWDVTIVGDGPSALAAARAGRHEAVLLDINLGGSDGGENVLAELRTLEGYENTPVLAVTAYALPGDRRKFLMSGFDGYISKPFTREQLFTIIEETIDAVNGRL